ncbi:MAG: ABC transporter ATP-binding protein [Bosea sp. (in: a-proteobacteria)]
MIRFSGVGKVYGDLTVIKDFDLDIAKGEFCVLIGASGSGKSTILKMINRLEEHDAGEIRFAGAEIRSFQPEIIRRRMGYAIQSIGLFPHWTIAQNIATVPRLLGWDPGRIDQRITELLKLLDLDAERFRKAYPHQLSGGQQQRVGVARALAADPDVLLMDEPFGALDPIAREGLQAEIARIHRATAKTIVFVTHDIDEALKLATRIVLIDKGSIVQADTPRALLKAPASAFVREFLGADDLGLKLLSLEKVSDHMRVEVTHPGGETISGNDNLRKALSRLITIRSECLSVTGETGEVIGTLHRSDIVS